MANNVFTFGSGYRLFCSYWWKHWLRPRTWYRPFVFAYQRVTRGWADCDVWSIDSWLCGVIPPAVDKLRTNDFGYPSGLEPEQWTQILTEIADGFRAGKLIGEVPEEFITLSETEIDDLFGRGPKPIYDWDGIGAYQAEQRKKFEHGMDLFKQYFFNLWD